MQFGDKFILLVPYFFLKDMLTLLLIFFSISESLKDVQLRWRNLAVSLVLVTSDSICLFDCHSVGLYTSPMFFSFLIVLPFSSLIFSLQAHNIDF